MKFAHLADVHIGAWRDPALKSLAIESLKRAVSIIIEKKVDFVIIAGDLFNTSVPAIDHLQETVVLLKKLKSAGMPVYVVPGSHDYSASGKTIIDVLEEADLLINVMKGKVSDGKLVLEFTVDSKTGVKLTGLGGRRGSLEEKEYASLDLYSLEAEAGPKIFVFHSSIDEMKPDEMYSMISISANQLPSGFDYYAGGHVHVVQKMSFEGRSIVVYPGPVYPANFHELWSLGRGSFFIYDKGSLEQVSLNTKSVHKIDIDAEGRSPEEVFHDIESAIKLKEFNNTLVLLRVGGKLRSGKVSDIDFKSITKQIYNKSAFFVMRSTTRLSSEEFQESSSKNVSAEDIEDELIRECMPENKGQGLAVVAKSLLKSLSEEQNDGEKKYEYDSRMKKEADKILGV